MPSSKPTKDDITLATIAHLLGFTGFLGPLLLWLLKKDVPFVAEQAKESLNFQISIMIYSFVSFVLAIFLIGFLLIPALILLNVVCIILAAMQANKGNPYRYPLTIRLVK